MAIHQPALGRTIPLPEDAPDTPVIPLPVVPVNPTLPTIPAVVVDGRGKDKGDKPTTPPATGTPTGDGPLASLDGNKSGLVIFAVIAVLILLWE